MVTSGIRGRVRAHPLAVTVGLSVLGYSIVIGTFLDALPASIYPALTLA